MKPKTLTAIALAVCTGACAKEAGSSTGQAQAILRQEDQFGRRTTDLFQCSARNRTRVCCALLKQRAAQKAIEEQAAASEGSAKHVSDNRTALARAGFLSSRRGRSTFHSQSQSRSQRQPAARTMTITCEGVGKWFGTHQVLRDVNLDAAFDHTIALIGPSGGGQVHPVANTCGLGASRQRDDFSEWAAPRFRRKIP